jgi:hypothetical protein
MVPFGLFDAFGSLRAASLGDARDFPHDNFEGFVQIAIRIVRESEFFVSEPVCLHWKFKNLDQLQLDVLHSVTRRKITADW